MALDDSIAEDSPDVRRAVDVSDLDALMAGSLIEVTPINHASIEGIGLGKLVAQNDIFTEVLIMKFLID